MKIFEKDLPSAEFLTDGVEKMNAFGTRLTGSDGQRAFCAYLKEEIEKKGFCTVSKEYRFDRWESERGALVIDGEELHVSSVFPYSGLTGEEGITAPLKTIPNDLIGFAAANGKIGVLRIRNLSKISSRIAFDKRSSVPEGLAIEPSYRGPVSTSFVKTLPTFWALKASGMKALICIWEDMSDEMVEGQYLNFILDYLDVPTVWVNETVGKKVLSKAKKGAQATVTVTGKIEKDATTESFYAVIPAAKKTKEAILINTHTDGCNFCEENGAIAMLGMMDYFAKHPTDKNLIFAFVTGHFRLPKFRTGFDQATSRFLADFKSLWTKEYSVIAGCSVEHLGCKEWKDVDGKYANTSDVDTEIVYTGSDQMDEVYLEAIKNRTLLKTITLRGHNLMHFGEGQPLFNKGIPEIALVTAPDYLCSIAKNAHMDKFNPLLMREQTETFIRCVCLLSEKKKAELGSSQLYSLGLGKLK